MPIIHNTPQFVDRRKELRNHGTHEEAVLWLELQNNKLGVKFRRQHSIGGYIVDFYCPKKFLIIEIDGAQHYEKDAQEYDDKRTLYFESLGKRVVRFSNKEILTNLSSVVDRIKIELEKLPPRAPEARRPLLTQGGENS